MLSWFHLLVADNCSRYLPPSTEQLFCRVLDGRRHHYHSELWWYCSSAFSCIIWMYIKCRTVVLVMKLSITWTGVWENYILPVLAGDYTTCLKFLMRYPASADVQYIIQLALHLRNPKVSYSSLMQYDYSCCIAVFIFFPVVDIPHTFSMLQQYPRPPGYSSTATHHIPTVGGRPDVHRVPQHHSAPQTRSSSVPRTTQQVMYSLVERWSI